MYFIDFVKNMKIFFPEEISEQETTCIKKQVLFRRPEMHICHVTLVIPAKVTFMKIYLVVLK
ncbi:hypothetical protein CNR22_00360 [Sphingobacteriaceae bacterium]|nr:hypothetical protein CNR22_00360 [Sphingobacteriaceae bacterium]